MASDEPKTSRGRIAACSRRIAARDLSLVTDHCPLERETGIEPATNSLEGCDSTTELLPPPQLGKWKLETGNQSPQVWTGNQFRPLHFPISSFRFPSGGQGRIRTSVDRMGRQIYSLLLLTAQPPVQNWSLRDRTERARCRLPRNAPSLGSETLIRCWRGAHHHPHRL